MNRIDDSRRYAKDKEKRLKDSLPLMNKEKLQFHQVDDKFLQGFFSAVKRDFRLHNA